MTGTRPADILRQLAPLDAAGSDRELLHRFAASRDHAAFAELVRRHGPVVLAVCRRIAGHSQDAEDAFQAAFLVLARKADSISRPELLGNWLYGVAVRVAQKARRTAARRRAREVQVTAMPDPPSVSNESNADIGPVLHEELDRLPVWYRDAVILCDLRGASRADAAKALGIPEGTLSSRLATGRKQLADRLARRGIALSIAAVPLSLAEGRTAVPDHLLQQTCGLVADWAAGAAVPIPIHWLAEGGYAVRKLMMAGAFAVVAVAGVAIAARPGEKPTLPAEPPVVGARIAAPHPDPIPVVDNTPEEKPLRRGAPKMRRAFDLPAGPIQEFAWSLDGKSLAARTQRQAAKGIDAINTILFIPDVTAKSPEQYWIDLPADGRLVGFTPSKDGIFVRNRELVTAVREYHLVSGFHRLQFWAPGGTPAHDGRAQMQALATVDLESTPTYGYYFRPDAKTFRTVYREYRDSGSFRVIEVREVETQTGIARKPLVRLEGTFDQYDLSRDGSRIFTISDQNEVVATDCASGKRLWSHAVKFATPGATAPPALGLGGGMGSAGGREYPVHLQAAPNGTFAIVSRSITTPVLLTGDKGEAGPALENAAMVGAIAAPGCFSPDGRLLVLTGQRYSARELNPKFNFDGKKTTMIEATTSFTTVWDTSTGKVVKTWDRSGLVAFLPHAPVLTVLENNGAGGTRLGFWDFAE